MFRFSKRIAECGVALATLSVLVSVSSAQVSHAYCPHEQAMAAVLVNKKFVVGGHVFCRFAYRVAPSGSNVPFPLRYIFSDCTEESASIRESVEYRGVLYYEYEVLADSSSEEGVCSARFQISN